MQLPQKWKARCALVGEGVMDCDVRIVAPQHNGALHAESADRRYKYQPHPYLSVILKGKSLPFAGPQLAVVGQQVFEPHSGFIVGKQLVPTAAPHVLVASMNRLPAWRYPRVVPEQRLVEWTIRNLPDFAASLGQNRHPQIAIFEQDGLQSMKGPGSGKSEFGHSLGYRIEG